MGNIVPRVGIEPTSLAIRASVCYIDSLMSPLYLAMQLLASEVSADYYTCPSGIVSLLMLTITYIQAMVSDILQIGSTTIQNCTACTESYYS